MLAHVLISERVFKKVIKILVICCAQLSVLCQKTLKLASNVCKHYWFYVLPYHHIKCARPYVFSSEKFIFAP